MTAPAAVAEHSVKVPDGTEYVVLRQEDDRWVVAKTTVARTPENAIKSAHSNGNGAVYVAVPSRSWNPVKVTPKVETTLTLEAAKQ